MAYIKTDFTAGRGLTYAACSLMYNGKTCQKKLSPDSSTGGWYCERCNGPCSAPAFRYLVNLQIEDHSGSQWVTAFGEQVRWAPAAPQSSPVLLDPRNLIRVLAGWMLDCAAPRLAWAVRPVGGCHCYTTAAATTCSCGLAAAHLGLKLTSPTRLPLRTHARRARP